MSAVLFALCLCAPQEPEQHVIRKAIKQPYLNALRDYDRAVDLISSNPARAVELLTAVLDNSDVAKRECRLKIELDTNQFEGPHEFFPYQKRGLARLALADKTDSGQVDRILQDALRDFEESVRRNVRASEAYAQGTRKRIADRQKTDPEPAFLASWQKTLQNRQFVAARSWVEREGGFLSIEKKKDYLRKTDEACAEYVRSVTHQLRDQWKLLSSLDALHRRTPEELEMTFRPSAKEQLTVVSPEWEWCERMHEFVRRFREGKAAAKEMLELTLACLSLGKTWEETREWFLPSERMAFEWIQARVREAAEQSALLRREGRNPLLTQANQWVEEWKRFDAEARKKLATNEKGLPEIAKRDWEASLALFPTDPPEVSEFRALLEATVESSTPEKDLDGIERRLREFLRDRKRMTIEARQTLLTYVAVSVALRRLLQGKKPHEIPFDSYLEEEVRKLGGPTEEARAFGSPVEEALRKIR